MRKLTPNSQCIFKKLDFILFFSTVQAFAGYRNINLLSSELLISSTIVFLLRHIKRKRKFIRSPTILSTSTDCPLCSLLSVRTSSPLSCSLLMYRLSVQRRKACLLRWRVSKKGRQPVRCPSLHSATIQPTKQQISIFPCRVCSPSCRAPPMQVSGKVQIVGFCCYSSLFGQIIMKPVCCQEVASAV